jgi:hypothetical protein
MRRPSQRTDSEGRVFARRIHFEDGAGDIVGVAASPEEIRAVADHAQGAGDEWVMVTVEGGIRVGFQTGTPFVVDEVELHEQEPE